jgi:hypothetical protein
VLGHAYVGAGSGLGNNKKETNKFTRGNINLPRDGDASMGFFCTPGCSYMRSLIKIPVVVAMNHPSPSRSWLLMCVCDSEFETNLQSSRVNKNKHLLPYPRQPLSPSPQTRPLVPTSPSESSSPTTQVPLTPVPLTLEEKHITGRGYRSYSSKHCRHREP